ncbi:MAG: hypothetical protein ISS15_09040 [Alphaproteobacteria bacterium]|nr:hypothetical protein [Alphaproteobacteria bacterium]MBL6937021.1 hypothetical protein [Alphaproteobacteria bacterium]MBL7097790.1 hypothetical protein [Alphaproteobacteria bacterium]
MAAALDLYKIGHSSVIYEGSPAARCWSAPYHGWAHAPDSTLVAAPEM